MWIAVDGFGAQPYARKHLRDQSAPLLGGYAGIDLQRGLQNLSNTLAWVQRAIRVLEHHLHRAPRCGQRGARGAMHLHAL